MDAQFYTQEESFSFRPHPPARLCRLSGANNAISSPRMCVWLPRPWLSSGVEYKKKKKNRLTRPGGAWCRGTPGCQHLSGGFCALLSADLLPCPVGTRHRFRSRKEYLLRPQQKLVHLWFWKPRGPRNSSRVKRVHKSLYGDPFPFPQPPSTVEWRWGGGRGRTARKMPGNPDLLEAFG